jgi:glycosyltransferase involved in cell wall biosynthesis
MGHDVTLLFSRSSIILKPPKRNNGFFETHDDGFTQIMQDGPLINLGFSVKRIWSWIEFELRLFFWIKSQKTKPDLVIVSSLSLLTFMTGVWVKKKYNCRLFVEVRDIYPLTLVALGKLTKENFLIKLLSKIELFGYDKADLILSSLFNFNEYILENSKKNISKLRFIPMGIDPDYYNQYLETPYTIQKIPSNKFIVAYFGSFGLTQATSVIFDVIKLLENEPSIFFLIAGCGQEKEKGLIKIMGQNNYKDLGLINKKRVPLYLSCAHLALNPWLNNRIYKYGISPNKWMDYMFAGIPFIVSYDGEIEMLKKAGCATIIPPEDPHRLKEEILKYKEMNPKDRRRMGLLGKHFLLENLTYEKHAATLSAFISSNT